MLCITVPAAEYFDEKNYVFINIKEQKLQLEHSLVSLSKWEAKWHKPFLSDESKTIEESVDYVRCMTITQNVNPLVYNNIPAELFDKINAYIGDSMTATWFGGENRKTPRREIITAELIYYWMISFNIPMECQKWHLNRLVTLIRICGIKNAPPKKMGKRAIMEQNKALNAARTKKYNTKG